VRCVPDRLLKAEVAKGAIARLGAVLVLDDAAGALLALLIPGRLAPGQG